MKGIILAGGKGTRLSPSTLAISKQLLPIYDKPMIYYPLSVLMLAGIKEILIISTPEHLPLYEKLLGTGENLGVQFSYQIQDEPRGLAEAFILGEKFIGNDSVCLILGDNIFYGHALTDKLKKSSALQKGGVVFGYYVEDPTSYGVLEFTSDKKVIGVEEKPSHPKSNYAIPGLYFFDNQCVSFAKNIKPSARGELEITSLIEQYIQTGNLNVELLGRGFAWLDTGTCEGMMEASSFVHIIEKRQGLKIACLEEIAYTMGFIDLEGLKKAVIPVAKSDYGTYLQNLIHSIEK